MNIDLSSRKEAYETYMEKAITDISLEQIQIDTTPFTPEDIMAIKRYIYYARNSFKNNPCGEEISVAYQLVIHSILGMFDKDKDRCIRLIRHLTRDLEEGKFERAWGIVGCVDAIYHYADN